MPNQADLPKENYVAQLQQDILDANQQAREVLKTSQKRVKVDCDVKSRKFEYRKGDTVYICDRTTIKGLCSKLRSPWKGPGLIANILTPYLLEVQIKNRISVVNHDHVKKLLKWLVKARLKLDEPEIYCLCRKADNGQPTCLELFHCVRVGLRRREADTLNQFLCHEYQD